MKKHLDEETLKKLRPLEFRIANAAQTGCVSEAENTMKEIQMLLSSYGNHHRLLVCRLWYFETLLGANNAAVAESGFQGIIQKAGKNTRVHVEASFLLAVSLLRQKKTFAAKSLFKLVLGELNKIQSPDTRQLFQKRMIERMEEEAVLSQLIDFDDGILNKDSIHTDSIRLVQQSEDEIMNILGRSIPYAAFQSLQEVRQDALLQLSLPDRKLLPSTGQASQEGYVGRRAFSALKRITWKTVCASDSAIFKLWSVKSPKVFDQGYFAAAVYSTFQGWRIGTPLLAAGVVAVVMRYTAQEFCALARPEQMMEIRGRGVGKEKKAR